MVLDSLIEYSHFINQNQHIVFLMDQPRPLFVCFRPFQKNFSIKTENCRLERGSNSDRQMLSLDHQHGRHWAILRAGSGLCREYLLTM